MYRGLVDLLQCPSCRGALAVLEGDEGPEITTGRLECEVCGRSFGVEQGVGVLGDPDDLHAVADRGTEGTLAQDLYRRSIAKARQRYDTVPSYREWVDAAAQTEGLVVDIATGPGGSLTGALAPLLDERTRLAMTDASVELMHGLAECWQQMPHQGPLDFLAFDANHMPFRDGVVDAITSVAGFENVRTDRRQQDAAPPGLAYREAHRVLKPGGRLFEDCRAYAPESETAAWLESVGRVDASTEKLQAFLESIGFEMLSAREWYRGKGKSDPRDGLPVSEADEWSLVAYILEKQ